MNTKMKKLLFRVSLVFAFLCANHLLDWGPFDVAVTFAQSGQALTTTTTVSIISGGQNCFQLTAVTGILGEGPGINNPVGGTAQGTGNNTFLYIDRELLEVTSVNAAAKNVCTRRGQGGSQASPHQLGSTVWIGPAAAFFNYDPEGYCAGPVGGVNFGGGPSNPPSFTPWINQRTSMQWVCNATSGVWTPGFNNPGVSGTPLASCATIASAATITPPCSLVTVTGAVAIVTITPPPGVVAGQTITLVMNSVETWTAAGNIATAGTNTTAGSSVTFTWNAVTSKWTPSRIT